MSETVLAAEKAVKRLTHADYARIPADGNRHEIIDGEWIMTPAPNMAHQLVSMNLSRRLADHASIRKLGTVVCAPCDVVLSNTDVVQPDILFVSAGRASIMTKDNVQGAPDLVVEILSPATTAIDRGRKQALYEKAGVREYWIVDPDARTLEIHEFASIRKHSVYDSRHSFESALLPGLTVRLSDIF